MAVCSYCGNKCGWLRGNHEECAETCKSGMSVLGAEIEGAMLGGSSFADVEVSFRELAASHFISEEQFQSTLKEAFSNAAEKMALDGLAGC